MARERKPVRLIPVDDEVQPQVIRLDRDEVVRLDSIAESPAELPEQAARLDMPKRDSSETGPSQQPTLATMLDQGMATSPAAEQVWGAENPAKQSVPWGWFVLIGGVLAAAVVWSLNQATSASGDAVEIRSATPAFLEAEQQEVQAATDLIQSIEETIRTYLAASSVNELASLVRHPERVRPLMDDYYSVHPPIPDLDAPTPVLQPLSIENRGNFWMASLRSPGTPARSLLIETADDGTARIDWETAVCHQPMPWDEYATSRPEGSTLEFRVYLETDNLFSHEFTDSTKWAAYRLTALRSDEFLFGYARVGSDVHREIQSLVGTTGNRKVALLLRLHLPTELQSPRGVVIEKVCSPRWAYLDPPVAGS